ncbi:hypothetical protein ENBRE01_1678, partial [Enteropsectra breve]
VGPIPVPSPQASKVSGDQAEKEHGSPIAPPSPTGETVPPHNTDDNEDNTPVFTELADKTIKHNGSVADFYKKFICHIEERNVIHFAFLILNLNHQKEWKTKLPIIINNFNISEATDHIRNQMHDDPFSFAKPEKYIKVLIEAIVVLEHLFVHTKNEYLKLEEEAQQKIKNYNEKITSIQQGEQQLKPGKKKPLTIEELNGGITAKQKIMRANKDKYHIRLFSIVDSMDTIMRDLKNRFLNESSLKCSRLTEMYPTRLYMSYEPALQFLVSLDDLKKFVNMETTDINNQDENKKKDSFKIEIPVTYGPYNDDVILINDSKGYSYEDFYNDLEIKLIKRFSNLEASGLVVEMYRSIIRMDKVKVNDYNLTGAFNAAVDKIKNDNSKEKESMVIIACIVTILNCAYETYKNKMDGVEISSSEAKNESRKIKAQCYSNLVAINALMKEISNYIGTLINGPSQSNGYLSCCSYHSYLKSSAFDAMAFLKRHSDYKDFIEEPADSKPSDPPVDDDAEKKNPIQVVNNNEKKTSDPNNKENEHNNKPTEPNNKPTFMDKVDKHKGMIALGAIGAFALIIVVIVVLRSGSKGVAVPEASI